MGIFINAYEGAAFALARVTGYKVRRLHRKTGDICTLGFNVSELENVTTLLKGSGITLKKEAEGLWSFEGGDTSIDYSMIVEPKHAKSVKSPAGEKSLLDEVLGYNLAASTPMAAMLFLSDLQQRYGKK